VKDKKTREPGNLLRAGLNTLGISLDEQSITSLLIYMEELQKWNKRINLIARNTSPVDIVEKHFLDSLTLLPLLDRHGSAQETLLDVGTGAGFPGLVLAVALPEFKVILVEPRSKRVSFLRHVIRTLSLTNTVVVPDRLEDVAKQYIITQHIDFITSRAVADPAVFLPMVASFLAQGARVLLMLGRDPGELWNDDGFTPRITLTEKKKYVLPFSGAERTVCLGQKTR